MPGYCPRYEVGAPDVHPHYLVERLLLQLHDQHPVLAGARTGIVDEDVDAAKLGQHLPHHVVHLICVRDVGEQGQRFAAHALDLGSDAIQALPSLLPVFGADGL